MRFLGPSSSDGVCGTAALHATQLCTIVPLLCARLSDFNCCFSKFFFVYSQCHFHIFFCKLIYSSVITSFSVKLLKSENFFAFTTTTCSTFFLTCLLFFASLWLILLRARSCVLFQIESKPTKKKCVIIH